MECVIKSPFKGPPFRITIASHVSTTYLHLFPYPEISPESSVTLAFTTLYSKGMINGEYNSVITSTVLLAWYSRGHHTFLIIHSVSGLHT